MAGNGTIKYNVDFSVNKNGLNQLKSELQSIKTIAQQALNSPSANNIFENGKQDAKELLDSVSQLEGALTRAFNTNLGTLNVSKFNQELKNLNLSKIQADFAKAGAAGQNAFRNMTTQVLTTNMQLKQTHSLIDSMAETMGNTIKWGIASSIMNGFTRSVQNAYGYVKKLDTSLNNIMLVTDKSAENMKDFAKQANKAAKELGASTTAYTDAALIYYQQGLGDKEVAARAETTLKAANVTGQSGEEVSEQLTAVWNGYKVTAEETEVYVDKLAKVAASTASDLEELSKGMSKVASAANSMGVDVDQLNAQLATIISVTRQAPESVGTALKTIYARMGDLAVDGEDEFGVSLGEVSGKMEQMGVQITDQQGNLRDMGTVIEETAKKWDTWTEAQKQAAAVAMAGKRQYNNLIALFENWDMYEKALNTSANSVGFLQEQQEEYMDSMQAHLQELRTATESLYTSLIDSDSMNGLVDGLTVVVQLFDNFVQSIGGGGNLLLSLGAIGTRVFSKQIASGLATTIVNLRASKENASQLAAEMELVGKFSNLQKDDLRYQQILNMKKQELEYSKVITAEEREISNEYIRQTNELFKQQDALEERRMKGQETYLRVTGEKADFSNTEQAAGASETLQGRIEGMENIASGAEKSKVVIAQSRKEFVDLYRTMKTTGQEVQGLDEATTKYLEVLKQQRKDVKSLIEEENLDVKVKKQLEKALQEYDRAVKKAKGNKVEDQRVRDAGTQLEKAYRLAIEETIKELREAKNAADTYAQELDELNNKLLNGKIAWEGFTSSISLKSMINNTVQAVGAVGQLAMSINYLRSMIEIFKNDELSFGEKTLQFIQNLSFMLPMVISGFSGLAKAMATTAAGQGYLAAAEAARIPILIAQVQAGKLSNITEEEKIKILAILQKQQQGVALTEAEAALVAGLHSTANLGLAGTLKVASAAMKGFFASMGPIGWIILVVGLLASAIGLLSAAVGDIETAEEKANRQLKESQQALQDAESAAKSAADAYSQLKETIASYDDANNAIDDLTEGTNEWKEAVYKLNQQVLNLLQTYPELSKYITNDNGRLGISEEGIEYIQNEQMKRAENAQIQYYASQIDNEKKNFNASKERVKSDIQNQGKGLEDYSYDRSDIHDVQAEGTFKKQLQGDAASDKWMDKAIKSGNITSEDVKDLLAKDMEKAELTDEEKTAYADYISGASDEITDELLIKMGHIDKQKNSQSRGQITVADPTGANLMRELIKTYEVEGAKLREEQEKSTIQLLRLTSLQQKNQTNEKFNKLTTDEQNIINAMGVNSTTYQTKYNEARTKVNDELDKQKNDSEAIAKLLTETGKTVKAENIKDEGDKFVITYDDGTTENWTNEQLREYYAEHKANNAVAGNGIGGNGKSGYQEVLDEYNEKIKAVDEGTAADLNTIFSSGAISGGKIDFSKLTIDELDSLYSEINGNENWGVSSAGEDQKTQFAKLWGFDDYEIMRQDIIAQMNPEQMAKSYSTIAETASKAAEKTGTLIEALNSENELTEEQSAQLDTLEQKYTTLGDIRDRTSSEYKQALEEIQQLEETEAINAQQKATEFAAAAVTDSFDAYGKGGKDQKGLQQLKDNLEAFFDEEYELQISIADDLLSDVDNVINKAEGMQTAVAAIGDGFKVAADKSEELFDIFPELAHNAKVLSDGTIQLNQATVNSVLGNQEAVMNGDKKVVANAIKAKIQELEATNKVLDAEIAALEGGTLDRTALEDMFSKYKTEKQEEEAKNDKEVADTEIGNDAKVTKGVITNWEAKEKAAIAYGQTVKDIMAGKNVKKGRIGNTDFGVVSKVDTDDAKLEKDVDKLTDADIQDVLLKGKKNQKEANERIIADLTIGLAKMNYETTEGIKEAAKESEKQIELLENEKDLYHDINIEIQRLENSMEELERQQEKLYGQDLLNNLSKQLDLLEKQEDAQRRKLEIAKQEAATLKSTLAGQGTAFNADGTIANYQSLYDQKLAYVNSVIASGDEDAADAAQKAFEAWVENVERYDELISSEIPEIDQTIRDMMDERIEKQIEAFEYEITLKLDMKDAERDWNDFKKNMTIDEDDILGSARFSFNNLGTYLSNDGTIATLTDQSNTLLDQLAQMNATGTSSIYGDNRAALMEDIAENQDALMAAMEEQKDLLDEIEQAYFDMLDAAQEAFDEQVAQYEAINEVYSHGLNVINVLYGEDAYAEMEGFYQSTIENTNDLISFQAKQVQMWKEKLNDPSLTDEQRDEIQKKMQEAQAAVLSSVETQLDNIINKYTNAINKIFKELEDKMTGGKGLSYIQEEWDLLNKNADMYLDQVNSAYEVEKLAREYNKAIDATDSLSAQRKLNELMEEQLKGLREKEKLTQYDVDRANALLDIELKRIALEEAQQNKSKMRLRRDASGNYSYQFVSDEDATAEAQQELADAQNSLYNLDLDHEKDLQDQALSLLEEYRDKQIEILTDVTLSEEERQARLNLIRTQYGEMYNNILAQHAEARTNLEESALMEMSALNLDYQMNDLIPTWDSGISAMMEYISGEGGLLPSCTEAFGELDLVTQDYMTDLDTLEQTAGIDLGNVAEYTNAITESMEPVLEDNDELIAKYSEEIDLMGDLQAEAMDLKAAYDAITAAANAAVDAMMKARQTEADVEAQKKAEEEAAKAAEQGTTAQTQTQNQTPALSAGSSVTVKTTATHFSRDGGNGTKMKSFVPGSTYSVMQVSGNEVLIGRSGTATGWVNKTDLVGFNTGGYTGDWSGDGGRLAFLHKKELILNEQDTKNILKAVDVVRQIDGIMSSIMGNAFDRVNNQVRGLNSMSFPVGGPTSSEAAVAQHIEINADFPGVEKASEIISAFENLTNMATQYAFRTDR